MSDREHEWIEKYRAALDQNPPRATVVQDGLWKTSQSKFSHYQLHGFH